MLDLHNFLTQLHRMATSVDADLGELAEHITDVTDTLQQTVSGSAGLQVTVVSSGCPVTLDATDARSDDRTTTSLGIPLTLLSPGFEPGGRAVLYSTEPGAFVDLAADLVDVLGGPGSRTGVVDLDADLPLVPGGPLLTGLNEFV